MAKRTKTPAPAAATGEVGPRQPCPCGSGRRYKACHGDPKGAASSFVRRPFEGVPGECDLIALRELVPSATAPLTLKDGDTTVLLGSLLPGASPAMVRENGDVWLGLQVQHNFGDPSRDLGAVLARALELSAAGESGPVGLSQAPAADAPRLQDLLAGDAIDVTVHDGFGWWVDDADRTPETDAVLEQANSSVHPTLKLASVPAAYWTDVSTKEHLRWVMPEPEDALLDALARLHAAGKDSLVEGGRLIGMFRAHGVLTPVWDLPLGTGAEALEDPAVEFRAALDAALADTSELTTEERSARAGLANRQVTIR